MKILLVLPPRLREDVNSLEKYAPSGLIAVAGYIREKNKDIDVKIYDAIAEKNTSIQQTINLILENNPEILGLTSMTSNIKTAYKIAESVKKIKPNIIIVMGGVHATVAPEEVLSRGAIDFAVVGEGEITFSEFLENINHPENYKNIDGLGYKENGKIIINKRRELIKDLDQLPFPAYDLLNIKNYRSPYGIKSPFISVIRSRGCPFQCIFCGVQSMFGRVYRVQSPQRAIREIDYLVKNFGIKEIAFKDSEFTLNSKNAAEFCDLLIERNYDLAWSCTARVDCGSFELYKKMKDAGCVVITFGAEAGDQNILNIIKKGITIEQIWQAQKNAKRAGLKTSMGFMIGNPGETKETIMKSIKLAKELNLDYVAFNFTTAFPGTELDEMARKNNWFINPGSTDTAYMKLTMNATNLTNEELAKYAEKAYRSFYFRPSYILKRLTMLKKEEIKTSIFGFLTLLKTFFKKDKCYDQEDS